MRKLPETMAKQRIIERNKEKRRKEKLFEEMVEILKRSHLEKEKVISLDEF